MKGNCSTLILNNPMFSCLVDLNYAYVGPLDFGLVFILFYFNQGKSIMILNSLYCVCVAYYSLSLCPIGFEPHVSFVVVCGTFIACLEDMLPKILP